MNVLPNFLIDPTALSLRKKELLKSDFLVIENALPSEYCDQIVKFIDEFIDSNSSLVKTGYQGSMRRIWHSEKYSEILRDYQKKSSVILSSIFGKTYFPKQVLSMRDHQIRFQSEEDFENFSKGRWHYDSFRRQYKIFLFLRDVNLENGPFEFIPGTNLFFKIKLLLTRPWWLFNPVTHFTNALRPYASISDERVKEVIKMGYQTKPFVAKQGTLLNVNTSGLMHRAKPITQGYRYLAVSYF